MGLRLLFSGGSGTPHPTDPDPKLFEVLTYETKGDFTLLKVNYPNCTNFEGLKLVLVHKWNPEGKVLDPHFLESNNVLARFRPTEEGWDLGIKMLESMNA